MCASRCRSRSIDIISTTEKFFKEVHLSLFRNSLLVVNAIALVFGALIFIKNPWTFLLARTMQGVCVGFYSAIAPLVIK